MNPVVVVVQARLGSSRLPGKVLASFGDSTILEYLLNNVESCRDVDALVLAVPDADDELAEIAEARGWIVVRGSERDVLQRFVDAAVATDARTLIRLTADCPFLDPSIIDAIVAEQCARSVDYRNVEGYPRGVGDVELVTTTALLETHRCTTDPWHREHVTTFIRDHPERFEIQIARAPHHLHRPELRVCVDEEEDLWAARSLLDELDGTPSPSAGEVIAGLDRRPDIVAMNASVRQRS